MRAIGLVAVIVLGCHGQTSSPTVPATDGASADAAVESAVATAPSLPLVLVADVDLPGKPVRFDYQDFDAAKGHLVIAHMNDASVVVVNTSDGSVAKVLPGIPIARGVVVAPDVGRIFVTSSPNKLVIVDSTSLTELARVDTGNGPDGVGWDPLHMTVGVSDQKDGALSLIPDSGNGTRKQVPLGTETGNVVFDASRGTFWITVVANAPPDRLVAVDPVSARATTTIPLPGCDGAHGLRIHPDGKSALVACEGNSKVVRVDLGASHALDLAQSGDGPDVMTIDPGLGWLYVAAESGTLKVFDIGKPGLRLIDTETPGAASHTVAVDPATHHVFFPLVAGPKGTPLLRIMKPKGT
ncbi:MAG: YncE family protein [Polyangiales bacterium]